MTNAAAAYGRIVVTMRGQCALLHMVRTAQQLGALGVIIVDDGECKSKFDQHCVPGADKSRGEGFARLDRSDLWEHIHIPHVLMHWEDADQMLHLLLGTEHN